jgi:hypothetical protein
MPTLTLKNIPDGLHARLKASAERNRRSLNSEILFRLEKDIKDIQDISQSLLDPVVHAETLRAFAARLPRVAHQHVTRYKRQSRA